MESALERVRNVHMYRAGEPSVEIARKVYELMPFNCCYHCSLISFIHTLSPGGVPKKIDPWQDLEMSCAAAVESQCLCGTRWKSLPVFTGRLARDKRSSIRIDQGN